MLPLGRAPARFCVLIGAALASSSAVVSASTVRYQSDAELIAASARVVRARVLSGRGERGSDGRIYTVTTLAIMEDFSGYADRTLEVRELGGSVGNDFLYIGGAVQYVPGSEVVVCLERSAAGWLRSLAMGFSKFDVVPTGDGDALLRRNLDDTAVVGTLPPLTPRRLSSFRQLAERVRGVRAVAPERVEALQAQPSVHDAFTQLLFDNGLGGRWIEADSGTPVRWYIDSSAPPPAPGDASSELQTAVAGWTNPPQASIILTYAGFTYRTREADGTMNTDGPWPDLGSGAAVVFFEDPNNSIASGVIAMGGATGSYDDGGIVNGTRFNRLRSGFVVLQNAAALSANFRESRDFSRVLEHEVGHGIGLGHTQNTIANATSNIMYGSCCSTSTPIPPAIGPDDLDGLVFIYPTASACTYTLSSGSITVASTASSFDVTVSTESGCSWIVSGLPSWLSASVTSGTGNGSIQLSVSTNSATSQRAAVVSIASQPFTVTQEACACTVHPVSASVAGRGGTLIVDVSSNSCQWTATSPVPWITVTAGAPATGSGSVTLTVSRNTGPARSAAVTVAARSVNVMQEDGRNPIIADFNLDGRPDLVWHHQVDGRISVWHMNGISLTDGVLLTPDRVQDTNWKVVGVWDPNGDGYPDLLWRHETNGSLATWLLHGTTLVSGDPLSPASVADTQWQIVATADLDGDGNTDLVWQHASQGLISAWFMRGTTLVDGRLLSPSTVTDTNWRIVGSGDFNGDGHPDLVWHHRTTGQASVWLMNNTTLVSGMLLSPAGVADTNWQIRAVTDLNGDGQTDLVWQNVVTGYLAAWLMSGTTMVEGVYLSPSRVGDTGWRIAGPR